MRGKWDHGGVKTTRADSKTLGLDLGAFLGSVRGHSLARQRMVPHNHAVEGLAYTHHPNATRPYGLGWFLMRGTAPQAVQAEAGQFQRHFFSVPLTYARVRGKGDCGGVKTTRADSNALGLDLRAFMLTPARELVP